MFNCYSINVLIYCICFNRYIILMLITDSKTDSKTDSEINSETTTMSEFYRDLVHGRHDPREQVTGTSLPQLLRAGDHGEYQKSIERFAEEKRKLIVSSIIASGMK